jgi:hypothetical protein
MNVHKIFNSKSLPQKYGTNLPERNKDDHHKIFYLKVRIFICLVKGSFSEVAIPKKFGFFKCECYVLMFKKIFQCDFYSMPVLWLVNTMALVQ